jgi:hypothetical protein
LVAIGCCIWLVSFSPWRIEPFRITGQALLLILVLRAFCYWPPLVRWLSTMPVPHRAVLGVILAGMILGHYTIDSRHYFPFVAWEIFPFVNERDPVTCRQFIATTASGKQVRLLTEQLFPSIVQIDPVEEFDNPDHYPPGTTDRLIRAMAKVYNEQHAADPVRQVDLVLVSVRLHPPATGARTLPSCELLKRYDISSAPSN